MAQYRDTLTYPIQYQEVDINHALRLYTLENHLLNCAGLVADMHGFGVKYLNPQNMTWVLTTLSMELNSLPKPGDKLQIETWIENNIHMLSVRNFRLYVDDMPIGQVRSVWAVLHLQQRSIQNIFDQPVFKEIEPGEKLIMARPPHTTAINAPDIHEQHKIVYSDIDYNGHCNSCKYFEFMLNACRPTPDMFPLRIDLRYAKEVYEGDVVDILCKRDNGSLIYEIRTAEGELSCSARITPIAQE
ncbi:MAG: thioesterase [Paludibacter sp.]|nr:thioesterase [Bacteroidales bacterium]MCM1069698.1 thioesterase [Prevotella sp.]MCM1354394.1 thioesterase [Bacteroides sp.]MCM1441941.1 thioesterase [Muribaculum sp.]MCM1482615.1 thioesterase [Paludibacter sp.]